ncbi:MAG: hypothetical protein R3Y36_05195 [Spirochaetales bacterium]
MTADDLKEIETELSDIQEKKANRGGARQGSGRPRGVGLKKFSVAIPVPLYNLLAEKAQAEKNSVNKQLRIALENHLM